MTTPSGRKVTGRKKERKKKRKNAVNIGYLVPRQRKQIARTNNAVNSEHLVFMQAAPTNSTDGGELIT
jgi:hypothetical protein